MLPLLLLLALAIDGPEKCSLSGAVVDSVTGKGLGKVGLLLEPVESSGPVAAAETDAEGRFSMVELAPGRYRLRSHRSGYLDTEYGSRGNGANGSVLDLAAGQDMRIEHKVVPAGVIAGMVRDADGEPLEGVHISVGRRTYEYGRPRIEGYNSTDTDDQGRYRVGKLPPGRYYVAAEPPARGWNRVDRSPTSGQTVTAAVMTFYPGALDTTGATPVTVRAGARIEGIDIAMLRRRVYRVAGRLVNPPAEKPALILWSLADAGMRDFQLRTTTKNADGDFEFRGIAPGAYRLTAGPSATAIEVTGDIEDLRVEFRPGAEIRGRFVFEGDKPRTQRAVHVFITTDGRSGPFPDMQPDHSFTATRVAADLYQVRVSQAEPRRFYVKSIRRGESDALSDGLKVDGGVVPLEIVMSADGGMVDGVVTDGDGKPLLGATVVLVPPAALRGRVDLYRTAITDQLGQYRLDPAAPGQYKLFAWEEVEDFAWNDSEFLEEFEKRGEAVTVAAKERKTVKLQVLK